MSDLNFWISQLKEDTSLKYWNKEFLERVYSAVSYQELGEIGLIILKGMPQPIAQVCGPITSGGLGSIEKNLDVINRTIRKLTSNGSIVFNQMPFEQPMQDMQRTSTLPVEETYQSLLNDCYLPLFNSGLIRRLYFIYGWRFSFGAKWEHQKAQELGIATHYLEKDFHLK